MRLLSATNWYIRWPFIFEGIIYSLIGTVLGFGLATATMFSSASFLRSFLGNGNFIPSQPELLMMVFGGEVLTAIILGFVASFAAVYRYLK